MEWKVVNALSRDVERQQLNKILADIKKTTDAVATTSTYSNNIQDTVGKMIKGKQVGISVSYDYPNKLLDFVVSSFAITLTGDVTGSAIVQGLSSVNIAAKLNPSLIGIPEAPIDNMAYVRLNAVWSPLALQSQSVSIGEVRRRVSMGW